MLLLSPSKPLKMPPRLLNNTSLRQETEWLEMQPPLVYSHLQPQMTDPSASVYLTPKKTYWASSTGFGMPHVALTDENFPWNKPKAGHGILWNNGTKRGRGRSNEAKQRQGRTRPTGEDMAWAVWKQLPGRNHSVMNQFPWTLGIKSLL